MEPKCNRADAMNIGSANPLNSLVSNQRLSATDYESNQQNLQLNLLSNLSKHNKIVRLYYCFGCKKSFALKKMSSCLVICRICNKAAKDKGKIAKNNFVEKALKNLNKYLREGIR